MQTELDRIRLRTSHRFWPAVLFLPVPIVLIMLLLFFGLKPLPMVTPPPVDLQTCSGWEAAESTCDPLMSEWILQLPTREQYLAWTAHDIYEDVAAELPADVAPDVYYHLCGRNGLAMSDSAWAALLEPDAAPGVKIVITSTAVGRGGRR